jgi:hypothetical protein
MIKNADSDVRINTVHHPGSTTNTYRYFIKGAKNNVDDFCFYLAVALSKLCAPRVRVNEILYTVRVQTQARKISLD